jgi:hypothetical protein
MFDERRGAQLVGDSEISLIKASLNDLSEKIDLVHQESPSGRRGDRPAPRRSSFSDRTIRFPLAMTVSLIRYDAPGS